MQPGDLASVVKDLRKASSFQFSNGWLAQYAKRDEQVRTLGNLCRAFHGSFDTAENLHRHRTFFFDNTDFGERFAGIAYQGLAARELRVQQICAQALANETKRNIRHVLHWREGEGFVELNGSDSHFGGDDGGLSSEALKRIP